MIGNNKRDANMRIHANDTNLSSRTGFTLVELLVAMAVFATVITVVVGIFTGVVGSQRRNIYNQEVLDNARFVLEEMARSIRQSTITNTDGSGSILTINHPTKNVVVFDLTNGAITEKSTLDTQKINLTSSGVVVDSLNFVVSGNGLSPDTNQPRVTITISIRSVDQKPDLSTNINLETTVTPRVLQQTP